jgi:hypothetical protein
MLASGYAGSDGALEHHLMVTLYQLRQNPSKRITAFHSRIRFLWDQLALLSQSSGPSPMPSLSVHIESVFVFISS